MADPVVTAIPLSTWVKVATNVTTGSILPLDKSALYLQTIRATGNPAPTNGDYSDAKELDYEGAIIQASAAIDVYVAVYGSQAGSVRADL